MAETIRRAQNNFAGGEIGSEVLGRVNLEQFSTAVRYGLNVMVKPEGAIVNRPGTMYGGETRNVFGKIRFIPFEAPDGVSYVVEVTPLRFRFYNDNTLVTASGVPVEVTTPYDTNDIDGLAYAQSNDIMTLVHPNYAPRELRRTAFNAFSLSTISVNPTLAAPTPTISENIGGGASEAFQAYKVASVSANGVESLPSASLGVQNDLTTLGDRVTIQWTEVAGAIGYVLYKRRAGMYGFLSYIRDSDNTGGTAPTRTYAITDTNLTPNVAQTPKVAADPFGTDYPSSVFFYQQRRCFAGTLARPNSIISSQVGAFDGFRQSIPTVPDDYFEFALAAARTQRIRHVLPQDDLMIFTTAQEWRLAAENGFSAAQPPLVKPQSSIGISALVPMSVGSDVMFVPPSLDTVFRMNFQDTFNKYIPDDIGILARHMFSGKKIVDWCYAQLPHFLIFIVLDDGTGVMFTYNREQRVNGMTRFETQGFVECCCAIREDGFDRIYLAVRRQKFGGGAANTVRFFERMELRTSEEIETSVFLDCAKVHDNFFADVLEFQAGTFTLSADPLLFNTSPVRLYQFRGYQAVSAATGVLSEESRNFKYNGLWKIDALNSTQAALGDYNSGDYTPEWSDARWQGGGIIRTLSKQASGFQHLAGFFSGELAWLLDGYPLMPDQAPEGGTVSAGVDGSVELPFETGYLVGGFSYVSEVHTLELDRDEEPIRGRRTSVAFLVGKVHNTRGIQVGTDVDDLRELKEREYEKLTDSITPYSKFRVPVGDGWNDEVKLVIRQRYPLPFSLLSVIPEYTFGD